MKTLYKKCPKCGTRNFADDKECGICKSDLTTNILVNDKPNTLQPKKNNYLIVILLFAGLFYMFSVLFSKKQPDSKIDNSHIPNSIATANYTISKVDINAKNLFRIRINIENKLSENELIAIAKKAYVDIDATSSKGIVFFYLPDMDNKDVAWAKVDFPEISVNYIGQSLDDEQSINSSLDKITDYVGIWKSNWMKDGLMVRIRKDKTKGYVFEYISANDFGPQELSDPLKRIVRDGKIVYKEIDSPFNVYYVVEDNGDLSDYDKDGFKGTYKKLK